MRQCRAGLCEDDVRVTWLIPMTIRRFFTVIIMIFALFCHFAIVQTRQFAKESVYPAGSLQSKGHGNPSWSAHRTLSPSPLHWAGSLLVGRSNQGGLVYIRMKHIAALENESLTENGTFFSTAMSGRFISLILYLHDYRQQNVIRKTRAHLFILRQHWASNIFLTAMLLVLRQL